MTNPTYVVAPDMKINDIKFDGREAPSGKQLGLDMPGGHWVMKKTFLHAYRCVHSNWDSIDWSKKQTAKSMIGTACWGKPEERGLNQALGRCVKYFATHDMLPQPVEVARKRNGKPYKGGSVKYVLRGAIPTATTSAAKPVAAIRLPTSTEVTN